MKRGKKNRGISLVLAVLLAFSLSVTALAGDAYGDYLLFDQVDYTKSSVIRVVLDNRQLSFPVDPMVMDGTTLVPFRALFEALGLTVTWDAENQRAIGQKDQLEIILKVDCKIALVNGQEETMAAPALNMNGNILVPLRFVSETLDCHVVWVGESNLILISQKNIIEWRYGGYEAAYPYKEYEIKYINGVKTTETRYNGILHQVEKVNLYSYDGRMIPNVPLFNVSLYGEGWATKSPYLDQSYWINLWALVYSNDSTAVVNTKTDQRLTQDELKRYTTRANYVKLTVKAQAIDLTRSKQCFPQYDLLPEDLQDGKEVSRYDSVMFCLLGGSLQVAIPTSALIDALIMDGDVYSSNSFYGDYKYVILNEDPGTLFPFSDAVWAKIKAGQIWIGMTETMFLVSVNLRPDEITQYADRSGIYEEWVYIFSTYHYYYFYNGKLVSWYNS